MIDETLPQIRELLDAPRMRLAFERELGCRVKDCQLVRAKLRPGRNCLVTYRLKVVDPLTGEIREQLLSLLAFGKNESRERFKLALQQPLVPTNIGNSVFHLPELEAVVWAFPNDRKLTGLPGITDSAGLRKFLPEVIANSFGKEWKIAALEHEVVSYAAERSCTVRVTLELSNTDTGEIVPQMLFGKTYCSGEGETVQRAMQWLYGQRRLVIPQPLCFQPETNTIWQQGLTGKTLDAFDAESEDLRGWLAKAGATVAELHRLPVPNLPLREAVQPLEALAAAERLLACAVPACQPKLQLLLERLRESFGNIGTRPAAILHGDLHLKNFLATGGQIALLDWDNICAGDPMQELGSFIASLHYRALLKGTDAARLIDSFVNGYCATGFVGRALACPHDGDRLKSVPRSLPFDLVWHTAAALIYERASRHVVRLNADTPRVVDALIELSRRLTEKL